MSFFDFTLHFTVARVLCPRASKLLGHPGERGGGARASCAAKVHHLPTEAAAGPSTAQPLTSDPIPWCLRPGDARTFRTPCDLSPESGAWAELTFGLLVDKRSDTDKRHTDAYTFSGRTQAPLHNPTIHNRIQTTVVYPAKEDLELQPSSWDLIYDWCESAMFFLDFSLLFCYYNNYCCYCKCYLCMSLSAHLPCT